MYYHQLRINLTSFSPATSLHVAEFATITVALVLTLEANYTTFPLHLKICVIRMYANVWFMLKKN